MEPVAPRCGARRDSSTASALRRSLTDVSNIGYITAALTPSRAAARRAETVRSDRDSHVRCRSSTVTVQVSLGPARQAIARCCSQVMADGFGLRKPRDISVVAESIRQRRSSSIASGNIASRFAPAVAAPRDGVPSNFATACAGGVQGRFNAHRAIIRRSPSGGVAARSIRTTNRSIPRLAALGHWSPRHVPAEVGQTIRETVFWSAELTAPTDFDHVNSSLCHGFIFDLRASRSIDVRHRRLDHYVTMHDRGAILHPAMVRGRLRWLRPGGRRRAL